MVKTPEVGKAVTPTETGEAKKVKGGFKPQPDSKRAIVVGILAGVPNGIELPELIEKCQVKKVLGNDYKKSWRRAIRKAGRIKKMVFVKEAKPQ